MHHAGAVGKMVDCSQADDRRMIRLVKERKLLYTRNNMPVASYYTHVKMLWEEVASEMQWSVADVRRKWSHIRNSYSRHLRNQIHSVRTAKGRRVSRWYLADELDFLREHMATDTRYGMCSSYAPSFLELDMAEQGSEEVKGYDLQPWCSTMQSPDAPNQDSQGMLTSDDSSHSFSPDENSSYFHFFRGIHKEYQELPSRKQRLFKRHCLNMLHELLDDDDSTASGPPQDSYSCHAIEPIIVKEENEYVKSETVLPDD